MDGKQLLKERSEMLNNVFALKHNKRVMLGSNSYTWSILDAGYRLNEAEFDYDKLEKVTRLHHERYGFDIYTDVQNRNPVRVTALMGGGFTRVDDVTESVWCEDRCIMQDDEYMEFVEDPKKFYYTKLFRRYCKPDITIGELKVAVREFNLWAAGNVARNAMLVNEYGCLLYFRIFPQCPYEDIFQEYRGIKGAAMDLRRRKKELKALLDKKYELETYPTMLGGLEGTAGGYAGADTSVFEGYVAPITLAFLGHTAMNHKQFEELYWPYIKPTLDEVQKRGARVYIHMEGDGLRLADFFEDIPKGYILMHIEQDDPFEFRRRLPNIAIAGGMKTTLLGEKTQEECVAYAKKLIDEIGDGFVLDQDKMMSFRTDCKGENLKAVNDFARSYEF